MYSQRSGVAGSPEIHLAPTSSPSAKLNGIYLTRFSRVLVSKLVPVIKEADVQPHEVVFVRML